MVYLFRGRTPKEKGLEMLLECYSARSLYPLIRPYTSSHLLLSTIPKGSQRRNTCVRGLLQPRICFTRALAYLAEGQAFGDIGQCGR